MSEPLRNAPFSFCMSVVDIANRPSFKVNPTIEAGDFQVDVDGGGFLPLNFLPVIAPAGSRNILITLSGAEMNGENITVQGVDQAGSEWDEVMVTIQTVPASFASLSALLAHAMSTQNPMRVGPDLDLTNHVTFGVTLSGLSVPATWTKAYLTVKADKGDTDAHALLQLVVSNGGAASDGVLYVNKKAATSEQKAYGGLTVDQGAGTMAVEVKDDLTFTLFGQFTYDVKFLLADGSSEKPAMSARFIISETETHTV